jgi:predicted nuclease with TOPRIM domain
MVVYTCVCSKFETNHKNKYERHLSTKKHIDTSIVEDDRYKALEEKYKALEEKYKALEEKYKASEDKFVKDQDIVHSPTFEDDVSEDKVFSDMLSKTQDDVSDDKYIMLRIC